MKTTEEIEKEFEERIFQAEKRVSEYDYTCSTPCEYAQMSDHHLALGIKSLLEGDTEQSLLYLAESYMWLKQAEDELC